MRKYMPYLLGSVSLLFVMSPAYASETSLETVIAVAASSNTASVSNNLSNAGGINISGQWHHVASVITSGSFNGSRGVALESQNVGANSVIQNAVSLAYVASCATCLRSQTAGLALTTGQAFDTVTITGNRDYPGYGTQNPSGGGGTGGGSTGGGGTGGGGTGGAGNSPGSQGLVPQGSDPFAAITNSFDGSIGAFSVAQNAGNNSALQSSVSIGFTKLGSGSPQNGTLAGSVAENVGSSHSNVAYSLDTPTSSSIGNSFNGSTGILSAMQNSGSNSAMQNAVTVTYSQIEPASNNAMAMSAAISGNSASLINNFSNSQSQSNTSTLQDSFNGSTGILISSQNVGANSVVQNSVSVGAISP